MSTKITNQEQCVLTDVVRSSHYNIQISSIYNHGQNSYPKDLICEIGTWKENISEALRAHSWLGLFQFKKFFQAEVDSHPNGLLRENIKSHEQPSKELDSGQCLREVAEVQKQVSSQQGTRWNHDQKTSIMYNNLAQCKKQIAKYISCIRIKHEILNIIWIWLALRHWVGLNCMMKVFNNHN